VAVGRTAARDDGINTQLTHYRQVEHSVASLQKTIDRTKNARVKKSLRDAMKTILRAIERVWK
jgi:hypothetical protein